MTVEFREFFDRQRGRKQWDLITQLTKFMSVGVLNTLLDGATYYLLTRHLTIFALYPVVAKGVSYAVGMVNSYFWNRTWTFKSTTSMARSALLFTLTHVAALGVNAGVMAVCLDIFYFSEWLSFILATAASFVWNFALNKWVVFKPPPTKQNIQFT